MDPLEQRRHEEKERRRDAIVDAAEVVFGSKGYEQATMEQVAREARVSRALVYLYFKDKLELHLAVCTRGLQMLRERFVRAAETETRGADRVTALGREYMRFAADQPTYFAALSRFEAHRPDASEPDSIEALCLSAGLAVHEVTVAALQAGQADGSVRSDLGNPLLVAITLWGFVHGSLQIATTKGPAVEASGVGVQDFLETALAIAQRGIAAAG
ncbi:MAG: TetR/AcrR family transcriptional regulator [Gammaproteobacteria bacterium]|nr:TetR/AcrR family transcriptional regulator [Gammaproteobacteria bacterium]